MSESTDHRQWWLGIGAIIVCVGILLALLLPAIQIGDSGSRRRAQCMNNLKNLASATASFESANRQFPGIQSTFGARGSGGAKIGTWVLSLSPYLPQQSTAHQGLRDLWDDPGTYDAWLTAVRDNDKDALAKFYPSASIFICPSDTIQTSEYAGTSYVANAGFYLLPNDPALGMELYSKGEDASERSAISQRSANGLFANRLGPEVVDPSTGKLTAVFGNCADKIRTSDIVDGASNTLQFAEHMNHLNWRDFSITDDSSRYQLGIVWLYAGNSSSQGRPTPAPVTDAMRINHNKLISCPNGPLRARPSSNHSGIIFAAFADGSVRSIKENIDYQVYQSLLAPHDAESDIPMR